MPLNGMKFTPSCVFLKYKGKQALLHPDEKLFTCCNIKAESELCFFDDPDVILSTDPQSHASSSLSSEDSIIHPSSPPCLLFFLSFLTVLFSRHPF
jgi:hypothetical protein